MAGAHFDETVDFAQRALAASWGCSPTVFAAGENSFLPTGEVLFEMATFGAGAAVRCAPQLLDWCREQLAGVQAGRMMDGEVLYAIETELRRHGGRLEGECLRFLYRPKTLVLRPPLPESYKAVTSEGAEVRNLYQYEGFGHALNRRNDVLAVTVFCQGRPVAMAAADDTLGDLWQIGVDVVEGHRGQGLAPLVVRQLADAILQRGKQCFYTTWGANIASVRTALSAGFWPAWTSYCAGLPQGKPAVATGA